MEFLSGRDKQYPWMSGRRLSLAGIRALFGPGVSVATARVADVDDGLYPEERRHVARAVQKRRAEFGSARVCARRALGLLGAPSCALVPNADRSPTWPDGFTGSISHTDGWCVVAVASLRDYVGLGVDVERKMPLPPDLMSLVCTSTELSWIWAQPPKTAWLLGKLFFSAKEAFYKCQYPITGAWLDFHDVEIRFDINLRTFKVILKDGLNESAVVAVRTVGRFAIVGDHLLTSATLK